MSKLPLSRYLKPKRLQDVVAGIQMLALERWDKRPPSEWAEKFGRGPASVDKRIPPAEAWKEVFYDHPEFFVIETDTDGKERVSLIMRRAYEKNYYIVEDKELTQKEVDDKLNDLTQGEQVEKRQQLNQKQITQEQFDKDVRDLKEKVKNKDFTRKRLSPEQVQTLITAAIEMQASAIAQEQESRWKYSLWLPALSGLLGALLGAGGAVLAALLKSK